MTREDQNDINTFGRMNNRRHDFLVELKMLEQDMEAVKDAENEILLSDSESTQIMFGNVFVRVCLALLMTRFHKRRLELS